MVLMAPIHVKLCFCRHMGLRLWWYRLTHGGCMWQTPRLQSGLL